MTIKRLLLALAGMLAGWLGVLVVVGLLSDAAPAYVVMLPPGDLIGRLESDVAIMAAGAVQRDGDLGPAGAGAAAVPGGRAFGATSRAAGLFAAAQTLTEPRAKDLAAVILRQKG